MKQKKITKKLHKIIKKRCELEYFDIEFLYDYTILNFKIKNGAIVILHIDNKLFDKNWKRFIWKDLKEFIEKYRLNSFEHSYRIWWYRSSSFPRP